MAQQEEELGRTKVINPMQSNPIHSFIQLFIFIFIYSWKLQEFRENMLPTHNHVNYDGNDLNYAVNDDHNDDHKVEDEDDDEVILSPRLA